MKKIVFLYGNTEIDSVNNPLSFGIKEGTYIDFCEMLEKKGAEVFISRGMSNILTNNRIKVGWKYSDRGFSIVHDIIQNPVVVDFTAGYSFPSLIDQHKDINSISFKLFCANKFQSYLLFPEYFPESTLIRSHSELMDALLHFNDMVVKPVEGLKGQEISRINTRSSVDSFIIMSGKLYIAQKFLDTSKGIKGLVKGIHDLRVVVINKKIIWCHIRKPVANDFRANVHLGGTLQEISPEYLPKSIKLIMRSIIPRISSLFGNPVYSVDFGIENNKPYIYEFNSRLGFPRQDSEYKKKFIQALSDRVLLDDTSK